MQPKHPRTCARFPPGKASTLSRPSLRAFSKAFNLFQSVSKAFKAEYISFHLGSDAIQTLTYQGPGTRAMTSPPLRKPKLIKVNQTQSR
jgi:hypothetical protein